MTSGRERLNAVAWEKAGGGGKAENEKVSLDKGKPLERAGRKTRGLPQVENRAFKSLTEALIPKKVAQLPKGGKQ